MYRTEHYLTEVNDVLTEEELKRLMEKVYSQTCRSTFEKPGFSQIKFAHEIGSRAFRVLTVRLIEEFNRTYFRKRNSTLQTVTMGRYDQKETTKFHLDGGPEESYLVLGYEPSEIKSELSFADYTLAAFDRNISPKEFMLELNPMFSKNELLLGTYITTLSSFDQTKTNLFFVNNSSMPFGDELASLGVLHRATMTHPLADKTRVINSIQLGKTVESQSSLETFVDLAVISKKPYE